MKMCFLFAHILLFARDERAALILWIHYLLKFCHTRKLTCRALGLSWFGSHTRTHMCPFSHRQKRKLNSEQCLLFTGKFCRKKLAV